MEHINKAQQSTTTKHQIPDLGQVQTNTYKNSRLLIKLLKTYLNIHKRQKKGNVFPNHLWGHIKFAPNNNYCFMISKVSPLQVVIVLKTCHFHHSLPKQNTLN